MADELLQNILLPPSAINILAETTDTKTYEDTTKSLVTQILEGVQKFINSDFFIAWAIILVSSFVYAVCCGLRGSFFIMLSELFNCKALFSSFVLFGVYTWSDYMPGAFNIFSKKITFIPHRYNNDNNNRSHTGKQPHQYNNNQFENFSNKRPYRRKLEIY